MTGGGKEFQKELIQIAVPITLQCLMQSSFSVADQIMMGQLGSISIAGIGLGGKFASIYPVVIAAVASVAGIMIAQYTCGYFIDNIQKEELDAEAVRMKEKGDFYH